MMAPPATVARRQHQTIVDTIVATPGAFIVEAEGGVGKSVLAREYAWRERARYYGVWWLRAETRETLLDDLIERLV